MSDGVLDVRVGSRLWFDGAVWTVCRLSGSTVQLVDDGHYRTAAIDELMHQAHGLGPSPGDPSAPDTPLSSTMLASLTTKQRQEVERQLEVLEPLLATYEASGHIEGLDSAAEQLGLSTRTVRRRLEKLRQLGPAGLLDERVVSQRRTSVDPQWDEACLAVLDEFTNRSTPSRQTVIRRTNAKFLESVPDGRPPSQSVAYVRVAELDKGRYTFGEAKQRRSVSKRPQGVLGQLRPTRPGQYILMDGYRLDVFAMEPVTMRWVNTELTVAMDLFDRSIQGHPVATGGGEVRGRGQRAVKSRVSLRVSGC